MYMAYGCDWGGLMTGNCFYSHRRPFNSSITKNEWADRSQYIKCRLGDREWQHPTQQQPTSFSESNQTIRLDWNEWGSNKPCACDLELENSTWTIEQSVFHSRAVPHMTQSSEAHEAHMRECPQSLPLPNSSRRLIHEKMVGVTILNNIN